MKLYKQELKKTLKYKATFFVMGIILLIQLTTAYSGYKELERKCGDVNAYNEFANKYNGELDFSLVDENDIENMKKDSYSRKGNTIEDFFYSQYLAAIVRSQYYKENLGMNDVPKFYNSIGINALIQNITSSVSVIFVFVGLLFIIYPIFGVDSENEMDKVIYSTYLGRKKVVEAKSKAGLVLTFAWTTFYYFLITIFTISIYGNWNVIGVPINCIASVYSCSMKISVIGYLLLGYLLLIISALLMSACLFIIFSRISKAVFGIGLGLLFIFLPMFLPKNGNLGKAVCMFPSAFGSAQLIVGKNIEYLILNTRVPAYAVGIIVVPITTLVVLFIFKRSFWRGRIDV